jgi:hypothetical protein
MVWGAVLREGLCAMAEFCIEAVSSGLYSDRLPLPTGWRELEAKKSFAAVAAQTDRAPETMEHRGCVLRP